MRRREASPAPTGQCAGRAGSGSARPDRDGRHPPPLPRKAYSRRVRPGCAQPPAPRQPSRTNADSEVAVSHVLNERGGVVGKCLCASSRSWGPPRCTPSYGFSIDRIHSGGDPGVLAVAVIPGLFTLTFAALAVLPGIQRRNDMALAKRQALHPEEPWLWTDDWREGRITSVSSGKTAALVAVFAGFWNAFVVAAVLAVRSSGASMETGYRLLLALFGLVGLGLIAGAVYLALQARKSPPTVFEMSTSPGVLGGDLRGTISLPPHLPVGQTRCSGYRAFALRGRREAVARTQRCGRTKPRCGRRRPACFPSRSAFRSTCRRVSRPRGVTSRRPPRSAGISTQT